MNIARLEKELFDAIKSTYERMSPKIKVPTNIEITKNGVDYSMEERTRPIDETLAHAIAHAIAVKIGPKLND